MADLVTVTSGANSTLPANTVIATRQMPGGEHVQTVLGGPEGVETLEYTFTSSNSNVKLETVAAGTQIVVTMAAAMVDEACTTGVGVRLGLEDGSALGTLSSSGVAGVFLSHPGIAPGSGLVVGNGSGVIAEGGTGDDIIITSDAPTGGSLRVVITFFEKPVS